MSPGETGDWKTAWDTTAEEEWIDEQWAAEEDRRSYQSPGLHLQPEASAALGTMSAEGIWLQITDLVFCAIEDHWEEAEKVGRALSTGDLRIDPKDLNDLYIRAIALNPIFALNEFNYVNPEIRLDDGQLREKMAPLQALSAVIRMWTDNDHRHDAI